MATSKYQVAIERRRIPTAVKMQVYEAALTEALPDGQISERERKLLYRLRDKLGISIADAEAIERELREGHTTAA